MSNGFKCQNADAILSFLISKGCRKVNRTWDGNDFLKESWWEQQHSQALMETGISQPQNAMYALFI